jgi:hypothetical protein
MSRASPFGTGIDIVRVGTFAGEEEEGSGPVSLAPIGGGAVGISSFGFGSAKESLKAY